MMWLLDLLNYVWGIYLAIFIALLLISLLTMLGGSSEEEIDDTYSSSATPIKDSPVIDLNDPYIGETSRMDLLNRIGTPNMDDLTDAKDDLEKQALDLQQDKALSEVKLLQEKADAAKKKSEAEAMKNDYLQRKLESGL